MKNYAPVSVVIPCFQCEHTIDRAIQSILHQSLIPREIICVDDASTDSTYDRLLLYSTHHSVCFRLLRHSMNMGAASARNSGWSIATQPFIAFLDSDDSWHPHKIKIQYGYFVANPQITLVAHLYSQGFLEPVNLFNNHIKVLIVSSSSLFFKSFFATPTVMLRSGLPFRFKEHQRYSEDAFLWQQLALEGAKIARLELKLTVLYKPPYGSFGLSSHMLSMEKAELNNILTHYFTKKISFWLFGASLIFSLLKFTIRVFRVSLLNNYNVSPLS